jgi:hypothetical protein
MPKSTVAHVFFDEDTSIYLQDIANKTGWSVTYIANFLIRMMQSVEITAEASLKTDILPGKEGRPPICYRKLLRMKIKK